MDFAVNTPASEKKKPFAIASVTLILSVVLVFSEMILPYLRAVMFGYPAQVIFDKIFHFPTVLCFFFIMLCILCAAVATFFKKSNIFLIVSLFMLGLAYAAFAILDFSSMLNAWESNTLMGYTGFETGVLLDYVPYIAAGLCVALGFMLLGLTAVISRKKPSNLWILSTVLFVIAVLVCVFIVLRTTFVTFENLGWALEAWLDYGIGNASNAVYDFFFNFFTPVFYLGTVLLHFVSSMLLGLYLKKLAKQ